MTIRNPAEWGVDQFRLAGFAPGSRSRRSHPGEEDAQNQLPMVRQIRAADVRDVLKKGFGDFGANRTDVIFLCVLYPVIGLVLAYAASGRELLPLLFPLASGFALVGPFAGLGLYEMSRRRELGINAGWTDALRVLGSPSLGAIASLGLLLTAIFIAWLLFAYIIYRVTLGPLPPASILGFVHDALATPAGWVMIVVGIGVGFLLALLVLVLSVVAFPLLLDRKATLGFAIETSIHAVAANPVPMALWGLMVAAGLVIGSIPLFVGLAVVLPVLGHSTWHLYRKVVVWQQPATTAGSRGRDAVVVAPVAPGKAGGTAR